MSYSSPRYRPVGSILFLYSAINLRHSCSFSGVSRKESFGFGSSGHVNLVDTTAPMPTVEAKSSPPSLSSTWSPAYGALGPIRAFRVLPLWRTCQDDSGSEAGAWFIYGRLKKEYEVPQGQSSSPPATSLPAPPCTWRGTAR